MIDSRTAPYATLLLRLSLGVLFLAHAGLKFLVSTPVGAAKFLASVGVPGGLAYVVILGEVLAGIALILGICTRVVALLTTPILLGAILTVHRPAGFFFNNQNGGWEFPAFWIVALVTQSLIGDGAYALGAEIAESFFMKLPSERSH